MSRNGISEEIFQLRFLNPSGLAGDAPHPVDSEGGCKQTFAPQNSMSALPPKANMCGATTDVRFGPIADIRLKPTVVNLGDS
jgi:hypothetical protein